MALKTFLLHPSPKNIYLDTNFLVYALSSLPESLAGYSQEEAIVPKHITIAKGFLAIILADDTKIGISSMLFPEFWRSALINEIVKGEGYIETNEARGRLSNDPSKYIKKYFNSVKAADFKLTALLKKYEAKINIKESSEYVSKKACEVMEKYFLHSYDAIHIGSMLVDNVGDFATGDRKIIGHCAKDLNIWTYPQDHATLEYIYKEAIKKPSEKKVKKK